MTRPDRAGIAIPGECGELRSMGVADDSFERPARHVRELSDGSNADRGKSRARDRAHSPHQFDRQIVQEIELGCGIDNDEAAAFLGRHTGIERDPAVDADYLREWYPPQMA